VSRQRNGFDHVRLFAALLVLVSHHFALWGRPEPGALFDSYGGVGVAIFFALSGYLVSQSFRADPNAVRFMARRLLRILPGLAGCVLACTLVLGPVVTTLPLRDYLLHPQTREFVLMNLGLRPAFALPGVFADARLGPAVNGSLWTLPFEVAAYLLVAALGTLLPPQVLRRAFPLLCTAAFVLMLAWQPAQPIVVWDNDLRHVPRFLAYFLLGATLAQGGSRWLQPRAMLALAAALVLVPHDSARQLLAILLTLSLAIHLGRSPVAERFALRHDVSYGVYLYAFPVQQVVIAQFGALGFWPTMALALAMTWACAALSWRFIEAPMLRLKPRARAAAAADAVAVSPQP
jgi:peptidoglycan/LPS O-acetylase OafA/YrhL